MKVRYTVGRLSTEFEGTQVDVFREIANFQEIFEENRCGKCGSEDIRYVVRTDDDDNKYHELHCRNPKCRAKLAFGQHKKTETLFPKRRAGANDQTGLTKGEWLPDRGWLRWDSQQKKLV